MEIINPYYIYPTLRLALLRDTYPVYKPPHRNMERRLTEEEGSANFSHFIRTIPERMENITDWLNRFGIDLDYSRKSILKLQNWINRYGGLLVKNNSQYTSAYNTYSPEWTGVFSFLNLIYDIGTYLGEYLIKEKQFLYWDMYKQPNLKSVKQRSDYYNKPMLRGSLYPVGNALYAPLSLCQSASSSIYLTSHISYDNRGLVRFVESALFSSTLSTETAPTRDGDRSNGPLKQ